MAPRKVKASQYIVARHRGLTLVETLIAAVLLALLAAVCLPALMRPPVAVLSSTDSITEPELSDIADAILEDAMEEQQVGDLDVRGVDVSWIASASDHGEWLVVQQNNSVVVRWQPTPRRARP